MLESLRLDIRRRRSKFDLVTCPRLRKVHLVSARLGLINLPWKNVTHICIEAMWFSSCLKILLNAPLLDHVEFIDIEGWFTDNPPPDIQERWFTEKPIVTPLKSLKVVRRYAAFFFYSLTCPALEEFICAMPRAKFVKHITPFLRRSGPLRSFSMFDSALFEFALVSDWICRKCQKVSPTGRCVHGLFCERSANLRANETSM